MKDFKQLFGGNLRQFGMIGALALIIILFQLLTGGLLLTPDNLISLVSQYSYILILAIGMVMVIIAGHIDLSVGSVAAFVGIIVAKLMESGLAWPLALVVGLGVGALVGAWQGYWVAYVGVPAFIVTLAGMLIFRGANQIVGNSTSIPVPEGFTVIGAGFPPEAGPATPYNNITVLLGLIGAALIVFREFRDRRVRASMEAPNAPMWVSLTRSGVLAVVLLAAAVVFGSGRPGTGFPVSGMILVALVLLYSFITNRTVTGRHVYAVGGNLRAAALSGVNAKRVNFLVIMNMSILAALAGMIFVARSTASGPSDGVGWELDAIAAVFIGGAAVTGGVGTVIGSIVGGLVMAVLNNGLQLLGVPADRVQVIKGLVLLLAVAVDVWNKQQGRRSLLGRIMGQFKGSSTAGPGGSTGRPVDEETAEVGPRTTAETLPKAEVKLP